MELKSLLGSFWQLSNVLRIAGVQLLSIVCVAYAIGHLAVVTGVRGCSPTGNFIDYFFWVSAIVGIGSTIIGLFFIFFPALWLQRIDRKLVHSNSDLHLPYLSTRPVYVFLDAVMLVPSIAFFQGGLAETMCRFNFEWAFGWTFLAMTLLYPFARTISWYLIKRKIIAKQVKIPWLTLVMWWVLAIPTTFYLTFFVMDLHYYPRLRSPVVNEETYKGGLEANPKYRAGIVRVQGTLVRPISKCGLPDKQIGTQPFPAATVVIDMGNGNGRIIVKANSPQDVVLLENDASGKEGELFEAFGRLSKLPNPQKKFVCGLREVKAQTSSRQLALLEIELPYD